MIVGGSTTQYYGCGGQRLGREHACRNSLTVRRPLAEARLLDPIRQDLLCDEVLDEVQVRYRKAIAVGRRPDPKPRIEQLRAKIANLADAIAGGLLKS